MAHEPPNHAIPGGPSMSRRTPLGLAVAARVLGPLIGAGASRADSSTSTIGGGADGRPAEEEYEIPDGIGSEPWW